MKRSSEIQVAIAALSGIWLVAALGVRASSAEPPKPQAAPPSATAGTAGTAGTSPALTLYVEAHTHEAA